MDLKKQKRWFRVVMKLNFIFFGMTVCIACNGQDTLNFSQENKLNKEKFAYIFPQNLHLDLDSTTQIAEYVVDVFEDKVGKLWFGTMGYGVACYYGTTLNYFSTKNGLIQNTVKSITEDKEGNLWFATEEGVSKYDGKIFTNFTKKNGLNSNSCWCIFADSSGKIWLGTSNGVCFYDGTSFLSFNIPNFEIDNPTSRVNSLCVRSIIEDKKGNIWFGSEGYGAYKYDGKTITHYTKQDGLCSNNVVSLLEDSQGNIWFGSISVQNPDDGGVSILNGNTFKLFPEIEGLSGKNIYALYEDKFGNIWISSTKNGVYKFDGQKFTNYRENQGLTGNCIQDILEDKNGNMWFGFSGGLFRLEDNEFINITQNGPWK